MGLKKVPNTNRDQKGFCWIFFGWIIFCILIKRVEEWDPRNKNREISSLGIIVGPQTRKSYEVHLMAIGKQIANDLFSQVIFIEKVC